MKIVNIMLALGMAAVIADVSAKAQCVGPVDNSGSTTGSCNKNCKNNAVNSTCDGGPIVTINDWSSCGNGDQQTCLTSQQQIGTTAPCIKIFDDVGYQKAMATWFACKVNQINQNNLGLIQDDCGPQPSFCGYLSCATSTNPTPILNDNVYLASWGICLGGG